MAGTKARGLGRGLDALFASAPAVQEETAETKSSKKKSSNSVDSDAVQYIDINQIKPNKNQPRKNFDKEKIQDLSNSILQHGIIQPIVLRKVKNGYEIVAGERRWRAAREADLKEVPCIVRELSDEENMLLAIIENMQREDLNPIEEAEGLEQMIDTFGMTQQEVSKSVGKSRPYITNSLRLLKLPKKVQNYISDNKISMGHGRALINVKDEKTQLKVCDLIIKDGISVREVERIAAGEDKKRPHKPAKRRIDPNIRAVEEELKNVFGTRVRINQLGKKGRLEIEYFSPEELDRIIEILRKIK